MNQALNFLRRRKPAAAPAATSGDGFQALFRAELTPLITSPGGEVLVWAIRNAATTATVTDQFKANAQDYHRRYAASDHFEHLFRQALAATGIQVADAPNILDLGSGSGVNSIVPCQRLFPGARMVATDLSPELLAMLADYLLETGTADQVRCVRMDAMANHVAPGAFDLVTGAAILHHLDEPERGIAAAARALKPGGHAIFFEPFHGWTIIRLAFERILAEARLRGETLDPALEATVRQLVRDVRLRNTLEGRTGPDFEAMDDKWLFSDTRVRAAAKAAGFSSVHLVPHNDHAGLYRDSADIHVRLMTGRTDLAFPAWATAILDDFDAIIPYHAKREWMLEGTMVMTK